MSEKVWPVHMKKLDEKDQIETAYAHNRKEEQAYAELGYTDNINALTAAHYPRLLYNASGATMKADNEDHEKELGKQGFGRKAVARSTKPAAHEVSVKDNSRVDALEETVNGLAETVAAIQEGQKAILDAIKGAKGK